MSAPDQIAAGRALGLPRMKVCESERCVLAQFGR